MLHLKQFPVISQKATVNQMERKMSFGSDYKFNWLTSTKLIQINCFIMNVESCMTHPEPEGTRQLPFMSRRLIT